MISQPPLGNTSKSLYYTSRSIESNSENKEKTPHILTENKEKTQHILTENKEKIDKRTYMFYVELILTNRTPRDMYHR